MKVSVSLPRRHAPPRVSSPTDLDQEPFIIEGHELPAPPSSTPTQDTPVASVAPGGFAEREHLCQRDTRPKAAMAKFHVSVEMRCVVILCVLLLASVTARLLCSSTVVDVASAVQPPTLRHRLADIIRGKNIFLLHTAKTGGQTSTLFQQLCTNHTLRGNFLNFHDWREKESCLAIVA